MPVYNGEKYLASAINSILKQTFTDFEFIIINDGSSDKTLDIILSYRDPRIVLVNQNNQGVTRSLNNGLKIAKGEYIARMDADDISEPERFAMQINFLDNNPLTALCGTRAIAIDKDDKIIKNFDYPPLTDKAIKRYYLLHNPFIHSSVIFRKSITDICGRYDETIPRAQDYEYWGRIISKFPVANLSQHLLKYRVLAEGVTKSKNLSMRLIGLKIRFKYLLSLIK